MLIVVCCALRVACSVVLRCVFLYNVFRGVRRLFVLCGVMILVWRVVHCSMRVACCVLAAVCALFVDSCSLFVVRWLFVDYCLSCDVVCCALFVVR